MITIAIKIKREDKEIMVKCFEEAKADFKVSINDLSTITAYESFIEILSKLRATQHNDSSIRLNILQVQLFLVIIVNIYSTLGDYEYANMLSIAADIQKAINKKVLALFS